MREVDRTGLVCSAAGLEVPLKSGASLGCRQPRHGQMAPSRCPGRKGQLRAVGDRPGVARVQMRGAGATKRKRRREVGMDSAGHPWVPFPVTPCLDEELL